MPVWLRGRYGSLSHRSSSCKFPQEERCTSALKIDGEADPSNIMNCSGHCTAPRSAVTGAKGVVGIEDQLLTDSLHMSACTHITSQGSRHPMTGQSGNMPNLGQV